jgi:hypothetical protein
MKKLLGLLSAASLIATTGASVVSCGFVSRTADPEWYYWWWWKDDWSKDLNPYLLALRNSDLGNLTADTI